MKVCELTLFVLLACSCATHPQWMLKKEIVSKRIHNNIEDDVLDLARLKMAEFKKKTSTTPATTTARTTTTTTSTTATAEREPVLRSSDWCQIEYCRLLGSFKIKSGVEWSEGLRYNESYNFSAQSAHLLLAIRSALEKVHIFSHSLGPLRMVRFVKLRQGAVRVEFQVEFVDTMFHMNVHHFRGGLIDGLRLIEPDFLVDEDSIAFRVVSTSMPEREKSLRVLMNLELPQWGWLAIFVWLALLVLAAILAGAVSFKRLRKVYRQEQLKAQGSAEWKARQRIAVLCMDPSVSPTLKSPKKGKRADIWTEQRYLERQVQKELSLSARQLYSDTESTETTQVETSPSSTLSNISNMDADSSFSRLVPSDDDSNTESGSVHHSTSDQSEQAAQTGSTSAQQILYDRLIEAVETASSQLSLDQSKKVAEETSAESADVILLAI